MTVRSFRLAILLLASGGLAGCEGAMVTVFAVQSMVKGVLGVVEPEAGYFGRQAGGSVGQTDANEISDRSARMLETGLAGRPMHWTIAETGSRASIEVDETTNVRRRVVNVREQGVEKAPLAEVIGQPYQPNFPIDLRAGPGDSYSVRRRLRRVDTFIAIARVAGSKWIMAGHQGRAIGYVYAPLVRPARDIRTVMLLREPPAPPYQDLPPQLSPAQAKVLRPPPPPRVAIARARAKAKAMAAQTTPADGAPGEMEPGETAPATATPAEKIPPMPLLPFASDAAAAAAAEAGPEATVEIVLAETPCRTVNYTVRPRGGYTVERAFRACKAGDGAWEIVAPLMPVPPSVVSTVSDLADTAKSVVTVVPNPLAEPTDAAGQTGEAPANPASTEPAAPWSEPQKTETRNTAPQNTAPMQLTPSDSTALDSLIQESLAPRSTPPRSTPPESTAKQSTPAEPESSATPMILEMRPVPPYAPAAE